MSDYDFIINPLKTCAFTGHRIIYSDFDTEKIKNVIENFITDGYDTFLVGMAIGSDTEFFKILLKLREENNIKIIACIPCKNQHEKFSVAQKKEYLDLTEKADEKIILEEKYTPTCMRKRNEFMIKNSSALIAYLRRNYGGTWQTVRFAEKYNRKIIFV